MSDTSLNKYVAQGDDAAEAGFTPDPVTGTTPEQAVLFVNSEDPAAPALKWWDGMAFVDVGSSGNVTAGGTLTASQIVIGAGTTAVAALGSLGTTTTLLHGNAAGAPTFGAVVTNDITAANVTLAKIANASANDKLLGSGNSGSGASYAEIAIGTGLTMTGTTLSASGGPGTVTTTGSPASGNLSAFSGTTSITSGDLSGAVTTAGTLVTSVGTIPGRLIGQQVITATGSGTYTPTSGTASIIIELQGGGGGGGGAGATASTTVSCAGGGSGGGWVSKRLTSAFSGAGYVVGAKGAGGSAGVNNGNNGSDTTFTATGGGGTVYTAGGGLLGTANAAATPSAFTPRNPSVGGAATNGDLNVPGAPAGLSFVSNGTFHTGMSGAGGPSHYSGGAAGQRGLTTSNEGYTGFNAGGYGGGGGGAVSAGTGGTSGTKAGGDGSNGVIIIWEYA